MEENTKIKTFEDDSFLEWGKGNFNGYCIRYKPKDGPIECINGVTYLKRIERFAKANDCHRLKKLNSAIDSLYNIVNPIDNKEELENAIKEYKDTFSDELFWNKIACMVVSMYCAEDNWQSRDGNKTVFGRRLYHCATKRIAVLGESADSIAKILSSKDINVYSDFIAETSVKIDIATKAQSTLFDF